MHQFARRPGSEPIGSRTSPTRRAPRALVAAVAVLACALGSIGAAGGIVVAQAADDSSTATPEPSSPPTTSPATTVAPVDAVAPTTVPPTVGPAPASPVPAAAVPVEPPVADTTTTVEPAAPAPAATNQKVFPGQLGHILATIRYQESRGNYTIGPNRGNASGAYQFIASTWNGYGGYAHAYLAPAWVQDERAALDVNRFLAQFNNDVSMIPVMWYYPKAAREPALMDIVPVPSAGNKLTVREYQQRWLAVFASISGKPVAAPLTQFDVLARSGLPPTVPMSETGDVMITYPALGPSRVAAPDCDNPDTAAAGLCSDAAPGIVFGVKLQPVLAVHDGVITDVIDEPGRPIAVTITDGTGRSYTMAGFNDDNPGTDDGGAPSHLRLSSLARVGGSVRAGQIIGFMGNSDPLPAGVRADVPTDATIDLDVEAIAPHIRVTVTNLDGSVVDSYGPTIDALFRQACSVAIGPWSLPVNGSGHARVTIETTDTDRDIDSEWVITPTGQVTASGWASMIYPNEGCTFAPAAAHGPGGAGFGAVTLAWIAPIDLPTSIWVDLALRDDDTQTIPVFRGR